MVWYRSPMQTVAAILKAQRATKGVSGAVAAAGGAATLNALHIAIDDAVAQALAVRDAVAGTATMVQFWQSRLMKLRALAGGLRSPDPRARLNGRCAVGAVDEVLRATFDAWASRPLTKLKALVAESGNEMLRQLLAAVLTVLRLLSLVSYAVLDLLRAAEAAKQADRRDDEALPPKAILKIIARPVLPNAPAH